MLSFIQTLRAPVSFRILLTSLALLISASSLVGAGDEFVAAVFGELSLPVPTTKSVVVCHGFGCQFHTQVALGNADRAKLAELLAPGRASPQVERRALAAATAWFDRRVGPAAGTTRRVALARSQSGDPAQMDCIDLSSNNTSLFVILQQLGLLRHHRVERPVSRGLVIDGRLPHTTAIVGEVKGGRKWAVDNWTHKYGEMPDVEPLEQWLQEGH
jgi:hypothetical protein